MENNIAKKIIGLLFLFFTLQGYSQILMKGKVKLISSENTPVSGVEISCPLCYSTISDSQGGFELYFSKANQGKALNLIVSKSGFEVVNTEQIAGWLISDTFDMEIVLCPEGYIEQSRRFFFKLGEDIADRRLQDTIHYLDSLKRVGILNLQEAERKCKQAQIENLEAKKKLNYYANKFSRIDKDHLLDIDRQAMNYLDKGKVEEAIAVYENSNIVFIFEEKMSIRDTIMKNVQDIELVIGLKK